MKEAAGTVNSFLQLLGLVTEDSLQINCLRGLLVWLACNVPLWLSSKTRRFGPISVVVVVDRLAWL